MTNEMVCGLANGEIHFLKGFLIDFVYGLIDTFSVCSIRPVMNSQKWQENIWPTLKKSLHFLIESSKTLPARVGTTAMAVRTIEVT